MHQYRNIAEAEAALAKYIPAVREITGKDITLERISSLMEFIGNPQDKLRIIHVAGTSGKTSTAYYIAGLLQGEGRKVGLTISPHIDSITERLQINLKPLDERAFCGSLSEFMDIIHDFRPEPTYFELLVAFAYWYFAKIGVHYAVIETGFGGTDDGTNVAQNRDKVCVITDIGLDHISILGDTLEKIAGHKAGIIHKANRTFMYRQPDEVTRVFQERARAKDAKLTLLEQDELVKSHTLPVLKELPSYQRRNWLLAREVSEFVARRDGFKISRSAEEASAHVQVPGRMDVQAVAGKTIVLDGAHNEQKMTAFVKSFTQKFPDKKMTVLLSLKQGKEYQTVLPLLLPIADRLIVTTFDAVQDLPTPSLDIETLSRAAKESGFSDVLAVPDAKEAYSMLLESPGNLVVVTGSFYLVSLVRQYIKDGKLIRVAAAIDDKRGLATDTGIPWNLPGDRDHERQETKGGNMLMGYNTYLEFDSAPPERHWFVVTDGQEPLRDGFHSVTDLEAFMKDPPNDLWLFGGAGVFSQTIGYADELHLTRVEGDFHCTKFFPAFEDDFKLTEQGEPKTENGITYRFEIWNRK